jgi:hypothetical protein
VSHGAEILYHLLCCVVRMLLPNRAYSNSRGKPAVKWPLQALLNIASPCDALAEASQYLQRSRRPYGVVVPESGHKLIGREIRMFF